MKTARVLFIHFGTTLIYALVVGVACYLALVKIGAGIGAQVSGILTDTRATLQSTNALIKDTQASLDDNYYDEKATLQTVAVAAKDTDDFIRDLHRQTNSVLLEAHGLLSDARTLTTGLRADIDRLTDSADADTKALDADLERIGKLTDDLDTELRSGAATAKQTATDLQTALADLDKLLADPSLKAILASSADASEHLAGSAESVDLALRPWRKKAGQLKWVIEKALGLIKITVPM
jgi:uncharacterized protein YoxC